jgi:hypothetical protein
MTVRTPEGNRRSCLYAHVSEQKPDLFQFAASFVAKAGTCSPDIMWSQGFQTAGLGSPTLAALYPVNVRVPPGVAPGSTVPVVVSVSDPQTGISAGSNVVTIPIQ